MSPDFAQTMADARPDNVVFNDRDCRISPEYQGFNVATVAEAPILGAECKKDWCGADLAIVAEAPILGAECKYGGKADELVIRRYTFRLYPNATQRAALETMTVMSCRLYNALIEQRRTAWDRQRKSLSKFDQGREVTLLRNDPELPEWSKFPSAICERVAERVDQAYKKYYDNVKQWRKGQWRKPFPPSPPGFQKSAEFSGFGYREHPKGWKWLGQKVRLQGVGDIKIRGRFPDEPVDFRTVDILRRDDKWEISIVVKLKKSGRMHRPTRPFSNRKASNSLAKTMSYVDIRCSDPAIAGGVQAHHPRLATDYSCSDPAIAGGVQVASARATAIACCSDPAFAGEVQDYPRFGPSRGRKNRLRRWRNQINRRNHAQHELTSFLAAHGGDIEVVRPPILDAVETGKGSVKEHGAMVDFKAKTNRDLLDRGIGGLCEKLAYKVEARGNSFKVTEQRDHDAMVPAAVVKTAKIAKKLKRVGKKGLT